MTSRPKLWESISSSTKPWHLPSVPCMPEWPAACGHTIMRFVGADQFTLYFSVWYMGMLIVGGSGEYPGCDHGGDSIYPDFLLETHYISGSYCWSRYFPGVGGGIWFAGMNILLGRHDYRLSDLRAAGALSSLANRQSGVSHLAFSAYVAWNKLISFWV